MDLCYNETNVIIDPKRNTTAWNKETKYTNSREPGVEWSCPHPGLSRASVPKPTGMWSSPCFGLAQFMYICIYYFLFIFSLSPVWFWFSSALPSTAPGGLYIDGAASPPGICDIRRASSLTYERCVGMREKPPRRLQHKSWRCVKTIHKHSNLYAGSVVCCELYILWANSHKKWRNWIINPFLQQKECILNNFPDIISYRAFTLKPKSQYGSVFRILFKAEHPPLIPVPNTIIRKCCGVSNWLSQQLYCNKVVNTFLLLVVITWQLNMVHMASY